ncbi:TPA: L,D-transpeptidase [Stenotrophomonas maltophilia]|nr:L,D-transpeptidase [Stenotrophomonas maltophilia]
MALTLAFAGPALARAQDPAEQQPAEQPSSSNDQLPPDQPVSDTVVQIAGWVKASRDAEGYPFAVMDKAAAQIFVFDGNGKLLGAAPGLFGSAVGDHVAPGIAGLALKEIPGRDRTTPAGRFIGGYGDSLDAGRVLWVDYDSAISIHPTATGVPAERRVERLASPSPDDNRVTHGCINVNPDFYTRIIQPTFQKGGLFYILPDQQSLAETFPDFAQSRATAQHDEGGGKGASK